MGKKQKQQKTLREEKLDEPDCHGEIRPNEQVDELAHALVEKHKDIDSNASSSDNKWKKKQNKLFTNIVDKKSDVLTHSSLDNLQNEKDILENDLVGQKLIQTDVNTQEDYDFIKFHLEMIPPDVLVESDVLPDDSDSEADDKYTDFPSGKQPAKKLMVNAGLNNVKANCITKTIVSEEEPTQETYSKIKEKMKHKKNTKKNKKEKKGKDNPQHLDRREMLREKLLARIEELKGKRNLTSDEVLEKKKLRRKESKLKLKIKRREEQNKGNVTKPNINGDIPDKKPAVAPVKDKSGKIVFSKFDFVAMGDRESAKSTLKGKDFKRLLDKVEKQKEKIEKLKEKNPEAAKNMASKDAWKKVMMKAEGEKIKDDPNLLKKSLKKKEKFKEKRKKQWEERKSQTENRMKAQQEKRHKNIMARKQAKVDKKIKRAKKKGRMVPGF